jgi:hypothetical protein
MGLEFDGVNGIIKNTTSDGDVTIKGNDGGSEISALVFDMSAEGTATFNHDVKLGDDGELVFGAGGDLKIRHDSSNNVSFIEETGSSNFHIRGNQIVLKSQTDNDDFAKFIENGAVELYYSNSKKFETTSSGVTIDAGLLISGSTPTVTVGDGGAEDAKILFDGNEQNFHIGLDDSTNKLTIGLGNALGTFPGFTMDENTAVEFPDNTVTIISSGNHDMLTLKSTDADANSGPVLVLNRDSGSPADNDACGLIKFKADDDGGNSTELVNISATFTDVSNGAEDAKFNISSVIGGSQMGRFTATASETVLNDDSGDIDFRVESNGSTHGLFVDAGNNRIGIGTSSPDYTLHIRSMGSPSNDTILDLEGNATDANCGIQFTNSAGTLRGRIVYDTDDNNLQFNVSAAERARINGNGNMSIGTSVELGRLHLRMPTTAGTDPVIHFSDAAGDDCGSIDLNASANTVAYTTSSDYRLKENVNYSWDATTELKKLKPAKFNFKADADTTVEGFLAHEVSDIVPIAVTGEKDAVDEDGNMVVQGIDQSKLVPLLVKTVQELEARITTLEG